MIRLHLKLGLLGESGTETVTIDDTKGLTARHLVTLFRDRLPSSVDLMVSINGRVVEEEDELNVILRSPDEVTILPVTGTGIEIGALIVYALIMAAVSVAINYAMRALLGTPKAPGVPSDRGDEKSATYAWDQITTNFGQGFPVPFVYGRHAVGGQVVFTDLFASTATGAVDDRLRIVLALSEGPIHAIGDLVLNDGEFNALGAISGAPGSGASLPNFIRLNNTLLENGQVGVVVYQVTGEGAQLGATVPSVGRFVEGTLGRVVLITAPILYGPTLTVFTFGRDRTDPSGPPGNYSNSWRVFDIIPLEGQPAPPLGVWPLTMPSRPEYSIMARDDMPVNGQRPSGSWVGLITEIAAITRFSDTPGARAWIRPGLLDQSPLPSPFGGAATSFSPASRLDNEADFGVFTYAGTNEIQRVAFVLSFPGGLYAQDPQGNTMAANATFRIEWRAAGATAWNAFILDGVATRRKNITATSIGPALFTIVGTFSGAAAVHGPIDVIIVRETSAGGRDSITSCVWRTVSVIQAHTFAYPRVALLGLEVGASTNFNGGLPNANVRIDGIKIRVWHDTHGFSPRCWSVPAAPFNFMVNPPGRNPAWVLLDFLTSPWGLGKYLTDADLDLPSFRRWAAFCDADPNPGTPWGEAAHCCDFVGDAPRPSWETVLAICQTGRATPVARNGKIGVIYQYRDSHGDSGGLTVPAKSSTQLITSGSCEKMQITWLPRAQRATAFMFQYLDEDQLYSQAVLPVEDDESNLNDPTALNRDEYRPEQVQLYGITRSSQVFREGKFRHRIQRLVRRDITFVTGPWALAAEPGDLIDVEHESLRPFATDVPTSSSITQGGGAVTFVIVDHGPAGATALTVRDAAGVPQLRTITGTSVVALGRRYDLSAVVTCAVGAPVVCGLASKLIETYEVVAITLQQDLRREVHALQWVPAIHDAILESAFVAGSGNTDNLPQPSRENAPQAFGLRVSCGKECWHEIAWQRPPKLQLSTARVFVRESPVDGAREQPWTLAGTTIESVLVYRSFVPFHRYEVAVVLDDATGNSRSPDAGTLLAFVAEEFPSFGLPPVTNVRSQALDDYLMMEWDDLDVIDLLNYEVRLGTDWASGALAYRGRAPRVLLPNPPTSGQAIVCAKSRSGLYGPPVLFTPSAWAPRNRVVVISDDDFVPSPAGTFTNTQWASGYISLTATKYSGTYESLALDIGYQGPAIWTVVIDRAEIENVGLFDIALDFPIDSGEARWRTINTRPASPGSPGVDWQTVIDDLQQPIDNAPSTMLVNGHRGETGSHTRVYLESRFEVGGVWSAYKAHADRTVVARKMQIRVTLNRESLIYDPRITALSFAAYL